ncbi:MULTISPECIES: hypothetical protein [unclassified Frankia]|uniref:hypothetical protein n=1 Tax=unclassified Frankia TaxID=2632575 RepID=UPI001EF4E9D5|nr:MULTISPECIES: hypothetical protein [unclassified Frankia]
MARQVAGDGVWRRLVTDPVDGKLLDYGQTTYRPPADLTRFVRPVLGRSYHAPTPNPLPDS